MLYTFICLLYLKLKHYSTSEQISCNRPLSLISTSTTNCLYTLLCNMTLMCQMGYIQPRSLTHSFSNISQMLHLKLNKTTLKCSLRTSNVAKCNFIHTKLSQFVVKTGISGWRMLAKCKSTSVLFSITVLSCTWLVT